MEIGTEDSSYKADYSTPQISNKINLDLGSKLHKISN